MCERCTQIDERIAHYRLLRLRIADEKTLDGIDVLIEQHQTEKLTLHPDAKE